MVLTRNEWFRNMRRNMGIYSRSPLYFWQKPLLNALRGGFSCFWAPKKCTKNAPKCDKTLFWWVLWRCFWRATGLKNSNYLTVFEQYFGLTLTSFSKNCFIHSSSFPL